MMPRPWVQLHFVLFSAAIPPLFASSIQTQPPEKIFAANCATCHGAHGLGGASWVDGWRAPWIAGASRRVVMDTVRSGSTPSMPAFAREQITDQELRALARFIEEHPGGIPAPRPPAGSPVVVNILDADPWYDDDGTDLFRDRRRVELSADQYVNVVNTGKTWHTITDFQTRRDSGFIGRNQYPDTGYYYAEQQKDLAPGCVVYHCHLHPYMQVEICTSGNPPRPLTRAGKLPLGLPAVAGVGEIWVNMQTQEDDESDQTDGAMQVIDAGTWNVAAYIPQVGNNPHSAWLGPTAAGKEVVITASWHDNLVTLLDAETKSVVAEAHTGAAAAHTQVAPGGRRDWVVTHHGSDNNVERLDIDRMAEGRDPIGGALIVPPAAPQVGAHGVWFCDDGDHFITANTFADTVSLYSLAAGSLRDWAPVGGKFPLNAAVMNGDPGCGKGYTTNLESASIAVFDVDVAQEKLTRRLVTGPLADSSGNISNRRTRGVREPRWAQSPIQAVVSPPNATTHGRYMVVSNKTSFNVSIVKLDSEGMPLEIYNFPSGLGAHGVTFGRKSLCDSGDPAAICYYSYIANSFEDYLGVYDLEKIDSALGAPGSAGEMVRVEGGLATLLREDAGLDPEFFAAGEIGPVVGVPITVLCPDCRAGVHVGDVPLRLTTRGKYAYLKQDLWVDATSLGGSQNGPLHVDLEVATNTGGFGALARPLAPPW